MSFNFEVGDKVCRRSWPAHEWVQILHVGPTRFLGVDQNGIDDAWPQSWPDWVPWEPPVVRRRWTFETVEKVPEMSDYFVLGTGTTAEGWGRVGLNWPFDDPRSVVVRGSLREVTEVEQ